MGVQDTQTWALQDALGGILLSFCGGYIVRIFHQVCQVLYWNRGCVGLVMMDDTDDQDVAPKLCNGCAAGFAYQLQGFRCPYHRAPAGT